MKFIEFKNFDASYKNSDQLQLKNLNFSINQGEMVAIIGPSGAGKSTILSAFYREMKIKNGDLEIENLSIKNKKNYSKLKQIYKSVGYLSQQNDIIATDDVFSTISRIYLLPFLGHFKKEKIYKTLKDLGILDKVFTKMTELSGGQQHKVEIAKLLLQNKKYILADEPTSNLDPKSSEDFCQILVNLNKEKNVTVVCIMHDVELAKKYFPRYIAIQDGSVVSEGNWQKFDENEYKKIYKF